MNFLKNIADKAKSVADSPSRTFSGDAGSGARSQEGFICPLCIGSFTSPEALQNHYESSHSGGEADLAKTSPSLDKRFGSLNLVNNFTQGATNEEDESQIYKNQVSALEEAKALLTSEVVSLRQKLARLENDHVPNGRVLDRANELATENVGLKAAVDDVTSENEALKERLRTLEDQKASRESKDDSEVLKQELINVQKAMDDSLQTKEKEYNKLKSNYEGIFYEKQQYIDNISEREKEIVELRSRLKNCVKDTENIQCSTDEVQIKLDNLSVENENNKSTIIEKDRMVKARDEKILSLSRTLEQKITLLEEKLNHEKDLKLSLEEAKTLIKSRSSDLDKVQKSLEAAIKEEKKYNHKKLELEDNLKEMRLRCDHEKSEKEKFKSDCSIKESQIGKLESNLEGKNKQIIQLESCMREEKEERERFTKEREELLSKIEAGEGVNEAIQQLKSENSLLQDKLQEGIRESKEKENELTLKIETLKEDLDSAKKEANENQDECNIIKEKQNDSIKMVKKSEQRNQELLDKQSELETEMNELREKLKYETESKEEQVELLQSDLNEKEKIHKKLKVKCDKSEQDNLANEDLIKELENKLTSSLSEKDSLSVTNTKLEDSLKREKQSVEKLKTSLNSASDKEMELEITIKNLQEKHSQEEENVKLLKQAKTYLQEEKLSLERSIEEREKEVSELVVALEERNTRLSQLESGVAQTEVKITEMRLTIEEALGKEKNLLSDLAEKNKTISAKEEENANMVISFQSQQSITERLQEEKDSFEREVCRLKVELETQEEKVCQLQKEVEKQKSLVAEEMLELRTARDLLLTQIVELKHDKEKLGDQLLAERAETQVNVAELEMFLQDSKLSGEKALQELQQERERAAEREEKDKQSVQSLQSSLSQSRATVEEVRQQLSDLEARLTAGEIERDEARSKVLELEAGLASALDERRGLLERLVQAEAETERTRNITVELRRKLDDGQAALHELGRENQSIQVELVKQSGRKWKDDTEVTTCFSCSNSFSLTNRKHHCRNCGNIFCSDCSAKQAILEGYKKPQRVCDPCFGELASK